MTKRTSVSGVSRSWAALGAALLALGAFFAVFLFEEKTRIEAREEAELLSNTKTIEQLINSQITSLNALLATLSDDWARRESGQRLDERLAVLKTGLPGVRSFVLMDRHGNAVASSRAELRGSNFKNGESFRHIERTANPGALYISAPYTTVLGTYTINVARMVSGPLGEFDGVAMAVLDPEFFVPILNSVLSAPDMRANVLHSDGILFMNEPEFKEILGKNFALEGAFFTRHIASGNPTSIYSGPTRVTAEGRLIALRTVRPSGMLLDKYLVVTCSRSLSVIFAGWRWDLYRIGGSYLVLVLLGCWGMYAYQRRQREFAKHEELSAVKLQMALDAAKAGIWEWNLKTNENRWSDQLWGLYGLKHGDDEPSYDKWQSTIHPSDRERVCSEVSTAAATGSNIVIEWKVNLPDNQIRWLTSQGSPEYGQDGNITRYRGVVMDITERKRMESTLSQSRRDLRAVLDNMPSMIGSWDKNLRNRFANHAYYTWFGIDPETIPGMHIRDVIGEERYHLNLPYIEGVLAGVPQVFERAIPTPDGTSVLHSLAHYIPDIVDGQVLGFYALITDITTVKQAEEAMAASLKEKEVLLREIHHRVKNNLQIVSSLLSLQSQGGRAASVQDVLTESKGRIMSMALIHEQLYSSHDLSQIQVDVYLSQLLPRLLTTYSGKKDISLDLEFSPIALTLDQSIPFGLIVNELVTNALKHGFIGRDAGTIRVSTSVAEGAVAIVVEDDGVGLPEGFCLEAVETLGLQLVVILTDQLHGKLAIESASGTTFLLQFPLRAQGQ
ncbi:MAG: PAS domain S-box protein [Desulfovibrio sp.]|nr:PAS domain S-box protein [Desulfovibrio sp.]MBI4961244.1 PAS domain S-box protein [Desulfovibrio sp.]